MLAVHKEAVRHSIAILLLLRNRQLIFCRNILRTNGRHRLRDFRSDLPRLPFPLDRLASKIKTVGSTLLFERTDNIFRMLKEIRIDINIRIILERNNIDPARKRVSVFQIMLTTAKNQDVRRRLGSGLPERRIRQPDCFDELSATSQLFTSTGIFLVHRIPRCNSDHETAGANLLRHFQQEVIMNRITMNFVIFERHVSNSKIETAFRVRRRLKALDRNIHIWIKLAGNTPGNRIQLHTEQMTFLAYIFRHSAEKIPDATRRLQNISLFETHTGKALKNSGYNSRIGVIGIQNGGASSRVLLPR